MNDSAISLRFRYLEGDYVRAMRAHYASHLRLWLDVPLIVAFALVGACVWNSSGSRWLSIACFVVSGVFTSMLIVAFLIIPPLAFRREPKLQDDISLTFSSECIHYKTAHIDSRLEWSVYSRALVDRYSYVLYYGSRSFTVIPKRLLQNAEQREAFDRLLDQNVEKIVRKK